MVQVAGDDHVEGVAVQLRHSRPLLVSEGRSRVGAREQRPGHAHHRGSLRVEQPSTIVRQPLRDKAGSADAFHRGNSGVSVGVGVGVICEPLPASDATQRIAADCLCRLCLQGVGAVSERLSRTRPSPFTNTTEASREGRISYQCKVVKKRQQ